MMKKGYLSAVALAGGLLVSATTAQAGLLSFLFGTPAPTASWQNCDVDGCRKGGSTTVESSYAKTKYPIILAHGFMGFNAVGSISYWYGIPEDLTSNGATVYVAQQAAADTAEVRGEQLLKQVKQILAVSGAAKINLIGHSHGAQSVRYVNGMLPGKVASVTSVGGVNAGLPVADLALSLSQAPVIGSVLTPVLSTAVNTVFDLLGIASGHYYDNNAVGAMTSMSTIGTNAFNKKFPDGLPATACGDGEKLVNGVRFYSWSGTGLLTNALDPSTYLMGATALVGSGATDGLIPQCTSHLGTVIRDDYYLDHFDEVNHMFGMVGFLQNPVSLFRQHANRLKNAGL